jgi:hypothetical protein
MPSTIALSEETLQGVLDDWNRVATLLGGKGKGRCNVQDLTPV